MGASDAVASLEPLGSWIGVEELDGGAVATGTIFMEARGGEEEYGYGRGGSDDPFRGF